MTEANTQAAPLLAAGPLLLGRSRQRPVHAFAAPVCSRPARPFQRPLSPRLWGLPHFAGSPGSRDPSRGAALARPSTGTSLSASKLSLAGSEDRGAPPRSGGRLDPPASTPAPGPAVAVAAVPGQGRLRRLSGSASSQTQRPRRARGGRGCGLGCEASARLPRRGSSRCRETAPEGPWGRKGGAVAGRRGRGREGGAPAAEGAGRGGRWVPPAAPLGGLVSLGKGCDKVCAKGRRLALPVHSRRFILPSVGPLNLINSHCCTIFHGSCKNLELDQ